MIDFQKQVINLRNGLWFDGDLEAAIADVRSRVWTEEIENEFGVVVHIGYTNREADGIAEDGSGSSRTEAWRYALGAHFGPNETKVWVEEKEYQVTLTVEVTTVVSFGLMERSSPITNEDAIQNAIGMFDWNLFEQEGFEVGDPIEGRADRQDAWESQNYSG